MWDSSLLTRLGSRTWSRTKSAKLNRGGNVVKNVIGFTGLFRTSPLRNPGIGTIIPEVATPSYLCHLNSARRRPATICFRLSIWFGIRI